MTKHRETLGDNEAMDREIANGYPTVGHLLFLVDAYKPSYFMFEVSDSRVKNGTMHLHWLIEATYISTKPKEHKPLPSPAHCQRQLDRGTLLQFFSHTFFHPRKGIGKRTITTTHLFTNTAPGDGVFSAPCPSLGCWNR